MQALAKEHTCFQTQPEPHTRTFRSSNTSDVFDMDKNRGCRHDLTTNVSSIIIMNLGCSALRTRRHANQGYTGPRIKEKICGSILPARKIRAVIPKINVSIVSIYNIICYFIYYIEGLRFKKPGHDTLLIVSDRVPSCPVTNP